MSFQFRKAELNLQAAEQAIQPLRFISKELPKKDPKELGRQINALVWTISATADRLQKVDNAITEINTLVESQVQSSESLNTRSLMIVLEGHRSIRARYDALGDELEALVKGFSNQLH